MTLLMEAQNPSKSSSSYNSDLNLGSVQNSVRTSPAMSRLVDGVFGFQVLSFLDAYSGYNQIRMQAPN